MTLVPRPAYSAESTVCTVQEAGKAAALEQAESLFRLAALRGNLSREYLRLLHSRDRVPNVPLEDLLNAKEAWRAASLSLQMTANSFASLIGRKRARDIRVIARMAQLAEGVAAASYGGDRPANFGKEDSRLVEILAAMKARVPLSTASILSRAGGVLSCDLESALLIAAGKATRAALNVKGFQQSKNLLDSFATKHGGQVPAIETWSAEERAIVDKEAPVYMQGMAFVNLGQFLAQLALIESTSKAMLASWHEDHYEAPADLTYAGTTWDRWVREGRISKEQNEANKTINAINSIVPATEPAPEN